MATETALWESDEDFVVDVRAAMLANDIYVAYQPIVDIRDGQLKKLEALARWIHPDRGTITPDVFIPWAERTGVIVELGEWILDRSCRDTVLMQRSGIHVDLSVNVSVTQFKRPNVAQRFAQVFERAGLAPERVWIEVTETVLLDTEAVALLRALQDIGVRLVIDDFGTGHANFDYLTRLVVDSLKVDKSFISGLGTEPRATAIVHSVIGLGRELGLEIVAEGIETESQRAQLLEMNVRLGQGWLFNPALRYEELIATYAEGEHLDPSDARHKSLETVELMRRSALRACRILDTDPEPAFDSLVKLASQLLSVPTAVISFVDADRQWFKARVGTDLTEVARAASIGSEMIPRPEQLLLSLGDPSNDKRSACTPSLMGIPFTCSYAGMPIRSREGMELGTFSVADHEPRTFTPVELGHLAILADQVSELLDLRRRTVELDDLYIGARQSGQSGRSLNDLPQPCVAVRNGHRALGQLTRLAGRRVNPPRTIDLVAADLQTAATADSVDGQSERGTWVHIGNRVLSADVAMATLLAAASPAELVGRDVDDFISESSLPAVRAGREMRATGFVPGPQLITLRALDGVERLCLVSTDVGEFNGEPAIIGSAREIIDAPRLMRQMVSGVIAEVSEAVIVTDPDLRVLSWNPAAARLYGWSEREVLGLSLHAIVGDDTAFHGGAQWDELQLTGSWIGDLRQRARNGATFSVASSVNLLRDCGEVTGIAFVNRLPPPG